MRTPKGVIQLFATPGEFTPEAPKTFNGRPEPSIRQLGGGGGSQNQVVARPELNPALGTNMFTWLPSHPSPSPGGVETRISAWPRSAPGAAGSLASPAAPTRKNRPRIAPRSCPKSTQGANGGPCRGAFGQTAIFPKRGIEIRGGSPIKPPKTLVFENRGF